MQVPVEARTGPAGVIAGHAASALQGAGLGDPDQRAVERAAGERAPDGRVLAGGQDQRQGRRALTEVGAGDLAGLDRLARAVEDVVRDLERDPEREAERSQPRVAATPEQAGGLEELAGLEGAALEIALDRRLGIVGLGALKRLAAREGERRPGEEADGPRVARRRELGEGPGEEVVAGGARGAGAVAGPCGDASAAVPGAVDQVVVYERRGVNELDGRAGGEGRLAGRRRQEDEQRTQPLAAGRERLAADHRYQPWMRLDGRRQTLFEVLEIGVEPRALADRRQAHDATPVCNATIPPAKNRWSTSMNSADRSTSASSAGPGKRRTLAGR